MLLQLPPDQVMNDRALPLAHYRWFSALARDAGVVVDIDESLKAPTGTCVEFRLDGTLCVFDFSDWITLPPVNWKYPHWFKERFVAGHDLRPQVHPLSSLSFENWDQYRTLRATLEYRASGDTIIYKQRYAPPANSEMKRQLTRRTMARDALLDAFGSRVDITWDRQEVFFDKCADSLCVVHVPGIWEHTLDRAPHQLMGLGVCVVCPDIFVGSCGVRPQANIHYVPIMDDYSDLSRQVHWCETHRERCVQIGQQAAAWFAEHSIPRAVVDHMVSFL